MSEIAELLDTLGFQEGMTYAQFDLKFYGALLDLKLPERDFDDTFGAYIKATQPDDARPLNRRERWLLKVAIVRIVKAKSI